MTGTCVEAICYGAKFDASWIKPILIFNSEKAIILNFTVVSNFGYLSASRH